MPNGTFMLTACSLDVTSADACGHFGVTLAGCAPLDFCNLKHSVAATMAGLQAQVYNCISFYRHFNHISTEVHRLYKERKGNSLNGKDLVENNFSYSHKAKASQDGFFCDCDHGLMRIQVHCTCLVAQ